MEMLLMGLCMALFGTAVAAAAFGAATRSETSDPPVQPQLPLAKAVTPTCFFSDKVAQPSAMPSPEASIAILLQKIENHVRMEQAAAESFLASPTQTLLHSKTTSPFVN